MGVHENIKAQQFPTQGSMIGTRVRVCFHQDTENVFEGVVLRDDIQEPFRTIIHLDDGRTVLGTECQYQPI